ncbi:IS1634 family transposase, partial [Nesterenkonia sphaerica]
YATEDFRRALAGALAARADLGPHALVLFDVSTLYFETDQGDGFRESGFSKERRLEPQITIGLLTDADGFPLKITAFEGNKAETRTMIPMLEDFMATHQLKDITVVADAGMVSDANRKALVGAGLSYIIGEKLPEVPPAIRRWMEANPDAAPENGMILSWPVYDGPAGARRKALTYYQYRENRAKRTLRGIDQQVAKAKKAVEGKAPVKRNRFVGITGEHRFLKHDIEDKARALAGWKAYITNLDPEHASADYVIGAYHQLWHIEKAFRMSKHDLAARPVFHRQKDSIDAHLTIVTAALAIAQRLEAITGWSRKRFITTARRYREVTLTINGQQLIAEAELPEDLAALLTTISDTMNGAH